MRNQQINNARTKEWKGERRRLWAAKLSGEKASEQLDVSRKIHFSRPTAHLDVS
jgi:hypothetical protein